MDPEKYALLSFSFFTFTFAHKNSIPFAITSLIDIENEQNIKEENSNQIYN